MLFISSSLLGFGFGHDISSCLCDMGIINLSHTRKLVDNVTFPNCSKLKWLVEPLLTIDLIYQKDSTIICANNMIADPSFSLASNKPGVACVQSF